MASIVEKINSNINKNKKRGTSSSKSTSSSSASNYDMNKQLANYQKRLASLGYSAEDVTDTRNPLEKILNLEKDQNVLFDIFELINRPQNALFSGIAEAQEGGDFLEGAKSGITGKKKTRGKDLLVNAGMDDTKGKLDLADVLGFGLDVFADPMDLPLIPITTAGAVGKAASTAGKTASTVSKVADAAEAGAKVADTVSTAAKVADTAKATTKLISPTEGLFRAAGAGIKGAAKLTDKSVEKLLGNLDAKAIAQVDELVANGMTRSEALKTVGKSIDKLDTYKALKKGITNTLDSSKMVGGLTGKARRSANQVELARAEAEQILKRLEAMSENTAKKLDIDPNKLAEDLSKVIESTQDTSINGLDWLRKLGKDNNTFEGTEESVKAIKELIKEYAPSIKLKNSSTPTKLVIDTAKSKFLQDFKNNKDVQDAISKLVLNKDLGYNADELKEIANLKEMFESDKDLALLLRKHRKGYSDIADIFERAGVNLDFARKQGYIRKAQGDLQKDASNLLKSDITGNIKGRGLVNEKAFATREYESGLVANRLKREELAKQLGGEKLEDGTKTVGKIQKRIEGQERKLSFNRQKELEMAKEKVTESLEKAKNFNINATKLGEREGKIRASIAKNRNILVDTQNKLNKNTIKRMYNIQDASLYNSFSQHTKELSNYTKEYNGIIEKLAEKDLPTKELNTLTKRSTTLEGKIQKLNAKIDGDLARVIGVTDKKTLTQIKQTSNALKKADALGQQKYKFEEALSKNLDKQKILKQSNSDTITALENKIKDLDLQLGSLSPERDARTYKEIERLQNKISILNSNEGKELFNLNYHAGMKDFINQATQYSKGAKVYNDAIAYGTFRNPNYIKEFTEGMDIPRGFVKIDGNRLQKQLDAVKDILPENSDTLQMLSEEFAGKKWLLDKDFANLINISGKSNEQANALVKVIDHFNNMFKKYKVLSPGFQMRNVSGNATNLVLSGMPANEIPEYYMKAGGVLNSSEELFDKVTRGIELTGKDADNWEILKQFYEGGFDRAGTRVQDLEQIREMVAGKKGPLNKLADLNTTANEYMDSLNRVALLMYANDNPKYLEKLGKSDAIEAVKYALMDPSNMSDFERNVMKKIIPFYTFTKQNLLFQATNIMKNTPKYNRLIKAFNSIYSNLDENQYQKYQKEGMQIPLGTDKDGNTLFLKTNLPLSDLGEFMSNPLQKTLASTSPLIRTPYEMVTGQDVFTGRESYYNTINDLKETITGKSLGKESKDMAAKAEQILSGLGVDVISTNLVKKVTAALKRYNGNMNNRALWAEIFRSILQNTDQEKIETSKAYDDLETYQAFIKELKKQGINVPTVSELNNQSKRTLRNVKNKRKLYAD